MTCSRYQAFRRPKTNSDLTATNRRTERRRERQRLLVRMSRVVWRVGR